MVHRRGQARGVLGFAEQAHLQGRGDHRTRDADEEEGDDRDRRDVGEGSEGGQDEGREDHAAGGRALDGLVDQGTGDERAGGHAQSVDGQHPGDGDGRDRGDLGHGRGDVGVDGEHAAEADGPGQEGEDDLRATERLDLAAGRGHLTCADAHAGHADGDHDDGEHAEAGDEGIGAAPAEQVAQCRGEGHAEDVRDRQPQHHPRHGPPAAAHRHERGGDHGADAQIGAVGQPGGEPRDVEQGRSRGEHRDEVAQGEQAHEAQEQQLAIHVRRDRRDQGRADDDADRVEGHRVAGLRHGDAELLGDHRQQTHGCEFGHPDAEGTDRQGEDGEFVDSARDRGFAHRTPSETVGTRPHQPIADFGSSTVEMAQCDDSNRAPCRVGAQGEWITPLPRPPPPGPERPRRTRCSRSAPSSRWPIGGALP